MGTETEDQTAPAPNRTEGDIPGDRLRARHPADDFTISPRLYSSDDTWFGMIANPSGNINVGPGNHATVFETFS